MSPEKRVCKKSYSSPETKGQHARHGECDRACGIRPAEEPCFYQWNCPGYHHISRTPSGNQGVTRKRRNKISGNFLKRREFLHANFNDVLDSDHIADCCEILKIDLRPALEDLLRQRVDDFPDPFGIEHTTGTFQAVANRFSTVREECPDHISIPVPVIDGKERLLRGTIFTTVECTWGFGVKQFGGSLKHFCTTA